MLQYRSFICVIETVVDIFKQCLYINVLFNLIDKVIFDFLHLFDFE